MPFSRRKMYTLQPGATASSQSSRSRFKVMKKKLTRRYRRPHSFRYPRHRPLVSTDSMVLHELVPSLPMPSEQELNLKFIAMVDELGLNREIMLKLPLQKKWQLYLSKQKEDQHAAMGTDQPQPQFYVEELMHFNSIVANASMEQADLDGNLKAVKDLKTALRTQPISFVLHFIELNGLEHMLDFLRRMNNDIRQSQLHYVIMGCIKALMNNPNGRAHVLAHPTGITVIAQSLRTINLKTKILTLEILGALCLVPGGHKKVLTAVVHFQQFACERTRFQTLLMDLSRSLDEEQEAANLQVAILSFFNALINYKTGEESLEFRLHVRHELLMLGIQPIITRLRSFNIAQLNKHLEIFDFIKIEDEREFSLRLQLMETVEYTNPLKMAEILHKKTAYTAAYTHYVSILYHCLLIPIDDPYYDKYWRLIDRMVQQTVIQQDHGVDPDVSPLPINIQKLILHLLKEDEQKALIRQMEEMKKAQDHMAGRLKRMEWDCETKTMERDGLRATVDKQKVQLEKQQEDLYQTRERQRKTERSLTLANQQVEELKGRCQQLESRLKEKNVDISDLPPVVVPVLAPPPPPPAPPPPPPGPPGIIPPPPPPGSGVFAVATLRRRKKNIPKPSSQLKSLNWVKLHDAEIQGTVWDKLDDTKIFGVLNLEDLEKSFYQKPTRDSVHFLTLPRNEQQKKEISFIEKKRAQNCTILLSRLKMNDQQIRKLVLSMDEDMRLGKDMVEQLLKYVPMKSEVDELQIHLHEIEKFSRADKFVWCMSQVPRYHERLRALHFKKTFDERMGEICPQIQDILAACHELMLSGRLQKVLEVVLALGNFMNKGSRGNASGFKLASLNKIVDTKSSADSSNNLMHFLLQTLEAQFPDTLSVEVELPHVRNAAKVELFELEKEFRTLQTDLQDLKDELDIHRKAPSGDPDDRFVTAVEDFAIRAAIKVRETDMLLKEMKEQFQKALHFFGEDPTSTTTDRFMAIFLTFFKSFEEAHVQIIALRKKKAEVEKRKKHEEQRKTETLRRREQRERKARSSHVLMKSEGPVDDGNLDELIDKLKSGELWHIMGQAKRRSRKLPVNGFGKAFLAMGLDTNRELTDSPTESQ